MADVLDDLLGREVVLDTEGPMVYLGRLVSCHGSGFWLEDADVHNCTEGHAPREQYIAESARHGIRASRLRVFVFRQTVTSASALSDVVED